MDKPKLTIHDIANTIEDFIEWGDWCYENMLKMEQELLAEKREVKRHRKQGIEMHEAATKQYYRAIDALMALRKVRDVLESPGSGVGNLQNAIREIIEPAIDKGYSL